ncbi:hypothetical protein [Anaerotruncus massiliensis (ex Togo et al. 2019)]|uniref:hypothetical protein n=1 Tax=Anaerotruncus TaxID=244127 RepID=UPI0015569CC5|nr:hypothetical protein [Anaerotruncus massiliensis (ex Togo et al. 2019)]
MLLDQVGKSAFLQKSGKNGGFQIRKVQDAGRAAGPAGCAVSWIIVACVTAVCGHKIIF